MISLIVYYCNIFIEKLASKLNYYFCIHTCEVGKNVKFYRTAKISNAQKNKKNIFIAENSHIKGELLIYGHGGKIHIGNFCYIGEATRIWSASEIIIGNRVLISHNVNIHDNNSHSTDAISRHIHFKHIIEIGHPTTDPNLNSKAVIIGDDTWIGFNVTILKGVSIGKRVIVGACSLITNDIPDDAIVVGNPARIIN